MRVCAVIPTYNNAATVADVVRRTYRQLKDIIVVVDGATDQTRDILRSLSIPLVIVDYAQNKGKGYALKKGFTKALELGFTHALTIDSDGQHQPEDIPLLLRVSAQQPECFVVGNRNIQAEGMPEQNTFANRFSNFWFTVQTGVRLPDTQSGLRVYPLERLHGLRLLTSRYEAELELLVFAAWAGEKIVPVPVNVYYPPQDKRVSHFRPAYDFTRISILNTILCLVALVYGLPRRWWRSVLYGPWFLFCWLIGLVATALCFLLGVSRSTFRRLFHYGAWVMMHTFPASPFRIKATEQALSKQTPAIYIANHTSLFDILAIVAYHPHLTIVAQHWVFSNPFFGAIAHKAGFVSAKAGYEQMSVQMQKEIDEGASILIFPEGTRARDGVLQRFHQGAFYMAQQLHIPVQPMLITGTFRLMSKGEVFIGKTRITLETLPPLQPRDDHFGTTVKQRTTQMHNHYQLLLTK